MKFSPNDAPPESFQKGWPGFGDRLTLDEQTLQDFRADLKKFRSFHRFQARFDFEDNGKIKGQPFYIKQDTAVGVTPVDWLPDPSGETGPLDRLVNKTGAVIKFNPKNGRQHTANLPNEFEQYTQGRISTTGVLNGRFSGGGVSKNLNNLQVPWIWSLIDFDALSARAGSTRLPEHEMFPVYHLYYNGLRLNTHSSSINRAVMEQFIQLGENP
jgi:hypothetical protein